MVDECEGCGRLLREDEGTETEDMVMLCDDCWAGCLNDLACHSEECECGKMPTVKEVDMSEQPQDRISDERLAKLVEFSKIYASQYPTGIDSDNYKGLSELQQARRELASLRASHKRMVEALEDAQSVYALMADKWGMEGNRMMEGAYSAKLAVVKAALADARKLEGK